MAGDKYSAVWVSHSSIRDFLLCPRGYYLKNIYRSTKTNKKIKIISPPLALGQIVHEVIEFLSNLPVIKRFETPLTRKFDELWPKVAGEKGGFANRDIEEEYKQRGRDMLRRISTNPGPLKSLSIKITMELPFFWLSEEDNIIVCGKIDWMEYLKDTDSVHIIDFKTGKSKEDPDSLQLPLYYLLASNCQRRRIRKASYWYIEQSNDLEEQVLPNLKKAHKIILNIAKKIKLARQLNRFVCPHSGCHICIPYEKILKGEGKLVGADEYGSEIFMLDPSLDDQGGSVIL